MKVRHLLDVPADVCCAEQVIAFNLALELRGANFKAWRRLSSDADRQRMIREMVEAGMENFRGSRNYEQDRYNEAAIAEALTSGLGSYMDNPEIPGRFIPDYVKLGNMFRINSKVE